MVRNYDVIFISESSFQERIIQHLIGEFKDKKYLWIKSKNGFFESTDGDYFKINFNHYKGISKSLKGFLNFPKLECNFLVGTQFTGRNCRFFEALIDYKELHLIDDGIGTPVILKNPQLYLSLKSELIKFYLQKLILFIKLKNVKNTSQLINSIKVYHTIYNYKYDKFETNKINPFQNKEIKIKENLIGFIGQPLVDYNLVSAEHYTETLNKISKKFNTIIDYYPDPSEKWIYEQKFESIRIISKNESLELYYQKNEVSKILVSYISSALLNLKLMFPILDCYYVKIPKQDSFRKPYYDIFDENMIEELKF